jgi:hypothetical protein
LLNKQIQASTVQNEGRYDSVRLKMGGTASSSGEKIQVTSAEDVENEDRDEEGDQEEDYEEESEEAWRLRREGSAQSKLDEIKRMLAIAFFAGLGIIVIVVAVTSAPLVTPNPEDILNSTAAGKISIPGTD